METQKRVGMHMFKNYLLAALRSIRNQKLFAIINIVGLSIGLAACTLIILFIEHEYSYDRDFADLSLLYRIESKANIPGQPSDDSPQFFGSTYELLPADYEEVAMVSRLQQRDGTIIKGTTAIREQFAYTDPEFLTMFSFPLVEGNREKSLSAPDSIVLTEEMARKHLGEGPWLGRTLRINEVLEREQKVTAVLANLPANTHFDFDVLLPIDRRIFEATADGGTTDLERWNGLPFYVYFKLKEGRSVHHLKATINDWVDKYFPARVRALVGIKGSELFTPRIIPVADIHMFSPVGYDMKSPGNQIVIYSFSGIALMILAIACVNFMNLATARSTLRAKEVALRKVMGASRIQLFVQFEMESLVSALFALLVALAMVELILPLFSNYTERVIELSGLMDLTVMFAVLCVTLFVGLLAGLHPALVLSGLRPVQTLTSNRSSAGGVSRTRTALVLFQFTLSAVLVIMTLLIFVQTDHARSVDLGYDNSNVLSVRGMSDSEIGDAAESVAQEIGSIPGVSKVSLSSFAPGDGRNSGLSLKVPGQDDRIIIFYRSVYPEFFDQFSVKPLAGRLLSNEYGGDRTFLITDPDSLEPQSINVVINETAVKTLGFGSPSEALGKAYYRGRENQIVNTVVGVIPDIHFGSPRNSVDAEIYMYMPAEIRALIVTYQSEQLKSVVSAIEKRMRDLFPMVQNDVQHLQQNIAEQYR
jgi:putative ABC transport system permease protein